MADRPPTPRPNSLREIHSIFAQSGSARQRRAGALLRALALRHRQHQAQLSQAGRRGRAMRPMAERPRSGRRRQLRRKPPVLESRLRHPAQSRRRWSTTRPTWCSRAAKRRPIWAAASVALDKYRKGENPSAVYPNDAGMLRHRQDQRSRKMIKHAQQVAVAERRVAADRAGRDGRGGRTHRAGAARLDAGVLRDGRNRRGRAGRRRRPPDGQGARQNPDGRRHRRSRSLSHFADAERHHHRIRKSRRRYPRPASISSPKSATPAPAWS